MLKKLVKMFRKSTEVLDETTVVPSNSNNDNAEKKSPIIDFENDGKRYSYERPDSLLGVTVHERGEIIVCRICGKEFLYSDAECQFNAEHGFQNRPLRCAECRRQWKKQRTMYKTTCSRCGCDCDIPFPPQTDRPIYCSVCYAEMKQSPNN